MFLLKYINLWKFHAAHIFIDLVSPVIQFVNAIKFFVSTEGKVKFELPDFKFVEYLADEFKFSEVFIERLIEAFVNSIKLIVVNIDKNFTEEQTANYNLNVLLAFTNYVKTLNKWNKDMIYLKLASTMLIYLFSKSGDTLKDHEATTMVQLTYSDNKLHNRF